jgi:hypothetical protein
MRTKIIASELRVKCRLCGTIGIVPNPEQDDHALVERFQESVKNGSYPAFIQAMAKLLIREYEKETKLPHFVGSKDYSEWLKKRIKP